MSTNEAKFTITINGEEDEYYSAPSRYDGIPACNVMSHGQAGPDRLSIVRAD